MRFALLHRVLRPALLPGALLAVIASGALFYWWRQGTVVASATFDPGIAPFDVKVTRVPVPVTRSDHFIVELRRGQYVVTAQRYFWPDYTPSHVTVQWPCIDEFTVSFDDAYVATCNWRWGRSATWTLSAVTSSAPVPAKAHPPGLSPYFFTPRKPIPAACQTEL